MKKLVLAVLCVIAFSGLVTAIAWAAPPVQDDGPDLVPEFSWDEEVVFPGAQIPIDVTYSNQGKIPVTDGVTVTFQLFVKTIGDDPETLRESEPVEVPEAAGLAPGATFRVTRELVAPPEGRYDLVAVLQVGDEAPLEHSEPFVVRSALPPGLARLFAGLGMFAAVMVIMAVGTEVVIDSVKVGMGLKQKVTALEALDRLKEELPGELAMLGVDAESLKQVDEIFKGLEIALDPVDKAVDAVQAIKQGHFGEAFTAIETLVPQVGTATGDQLDVLKTDAKKGVSAGFRHLRAQFGLSTEDTRKVEELVLDKIDDVTVSSATALMEDVFQTLRENTPQLTEKWLGEQVDTFLTQGRNEVEKRLDDAIVPMLQELGFKEDVVKSELQKALNRVEQETRSKAKTYTLAVRNLLEAVEERRTEIQSPLRKVYRRLRSSQLSFSLFGGVVVFIFAWPFWFAGAWWPVGQVADGLGESASPFLVFLVKVVVALVMALGVGLVVWVLLGGIVGFLFWLLWCAKRKWEQERPGEQRRDSLGLTAAIATQLVVWRNPFQPAQRNQPNNVIPTANGKPLPGSLGYFLRHGLERFFNRVLDREQDADQYGRVDKDVQKKIGAIGPTTVASVLLEREIFHQDEEASRIRMLRVVSIFVGAILAYALEIDALIMLEQALPGAVKLNVTLLTGEQLSGLWSALTKDLTAGIVLTGLAASAGSKFWRDLLGRLQATKQQAESAAVLLRKAKATLGVEEPSQS